MENRSSYILLKAPFLSPGINYQFKLQFNQSIFMTYHIMDGLANNLARILITKGVKRGNLVAIYMNKCVEMFISILAIHKSGAAFVPLDPEHPPERIRTILNLADSKNALISKGLERQFNDAVHTLEISSFVVDVHELTPTEKPDVGSITRGDLCHILFTSGSTGVPKGMEISSLASHV